MRTASRVLHGLMGAALLMTAASAVAYGQCSRLPCSLAWADEFDGDTLGLDRWSYQTGNGAAYGLPGWGNQEQQYYLPDNATVADGALTITAREQTVDGFAYTSARLRSRFQGDWTYGRFEARVRLPLNQGPAGEGTWPAVWMLPTDTPYGFWPLQGEIDIMEWRGLDPQRIFATLHYPACPSCANTANDGTSMLLAPGTSTDYHVYAVEWEPGVIRWYLDGQLYFTRNRWNAGPVPYPAPFDVPFHLILNLAVGGNFVGDPARGTWPQRMLVDYVRVYDMGETELLPPPPGPGETILVDDFEHNNVPFQWSAQNGGVGGGGVGSSTDVPPVNGGQFSMATGWGSGGQAGFFGTFRRDKVMDLTHATHFVFWLHPTEANQDFSLEINLQDDDTADGGWDPAVDDEFQFVCRVSPDGPCAVAGGGWQEVVVPIDAFVHDTSFATGGTGRLDTAFGGNGQAVNMTVAVVSHSGADVNFVTDHWEFLNGARVPFPAPALWLLGGALTLAFARAIGREKARPKA
ncbi:MAG: glycoside hydrolase family 16 protein [Pseudomonadota bacterium]